MSAIRYLHATQLLSQMLELEQNVLLEVTTCYNNINDFMQYV